LKVRRTISLEW